MKMALASHRMLLRATAWPSRLPFRRNPWGSSVSPTCQTRFIARAFVRASNLRLWSSVCYFIWCSIRKYAYLLSLSQASPASASPRSSTPSSKLLCTVRRPLLTLLPSGLRLLPSRASVQVGHSFALRIHLLTSCRHRGKWCSPEAHCC